MPTISLRTMQRIAIIIKGGADTMEAIVPLTTCKAKQVRQIIKVLERNGFAKREYTKAVVNSRIKLILRVELTDEGKELADSEPVKLTKNTTAKIEKPVNLKKYKSIMERDHTEYDR